MPGRLIERLKAPVRRRWPRLRLRTILLVTFLFVGALPGFGALFLRVYENTLVRQTEAELIAQGTALAAVASADWSGGPPAVVRPPGSPIRGGELSTVDLSASPVLPERPAAMPMPGRLDPAASAATARLAPVLATTAGATLASIQLLAPDGRVLAGGPVGRGWPGLPELAAARAGRPVTVLRRNGEYRAEYPLEWLSRASDLRLHHARPVLAGGRVVAVLLLSRTPRALFRGLYEDRGKILIGIGVIFAIMVALSGLLSRGIVQPIERLGRATRGLAAGGGVPEPPPTAAIEVQQLFLDVAAMADAIDRRSRYLRDFAHAVSHEFKTPLAGIRGALELLADHPDMAAADRRRFLANADADAGRLALLVSRLLELARADMAGAAPDAATDPTAALHRVADAHRPALAVTVEAPPALPLVAVPAATLEAVLGTLLDNARRAGAGSVRIVATVGDQVRIAVSDDGGGIAPADRARLFEPFFTTRRADGGSGLGLAIARSLLGAAGATIALAPESPTTFLLDLPRARG